MEDRIRKKIDARLDSINNLFNEISSAVEHKNSKNLLAESRYFFEIVAELKGYLQALFEEGFINWDEREEILTAKIKIKVYDD